MAYRIRYGSKRRTVNASKNRWIIGASVLLLAILFVAKQAHLSWSPGDPEVTADALSHLADTVAAGEPLPDAFFAFCKEIIDGAALPY